MARKGSIGRASRKLPRAAAAPAGDGRVRRGERNRQTIVDVMFELVGEGVLEPTADQIAKRAQVGLRSVFRHFSDMESLYAALDGRLRTEIEPIVAAGEPCGRIAERARGMLERRMRLFERIAPYKRAANLNRRRSQFLSETHQQLVRVLREHLLRWLPELAALPREVCDAVELATSFEAWDRLRGDQRLSALRAHAAVEATVAGLLGLRVH